MSPLVRNPAPPSLTGPEARAAYGHVLPVLRRLRDAGHEAYLVGGGVRDRLLGRTPGDWDVATSAHPDAMLALWPDAVPTGIRHGTLTVLLGDRHCEVTTYRAEGPYTDHRRPDWVAFGVTLDEDLVRRDFTINALAFDPGTGALFDPGTGLADLDAKLLRTVGDPDERFREDGLRPIRGVRFAAVLGFTVEPGTLAAMGRARPHVETVARERLRDELVKLLAADRPSVGLELLRSTGLLEVLLPELLEGVGMEQNRHHAYTVYEHVLRTLDAAPPDRPRVRLAALLHDIAKPRTRAVVDGEGTFHNHQHVGAEMAREILDRLRFPRRDTRAVSHLVDQHMFHYTGEWSDAAVRRFVHRVGREHLEDLFALRRADDSGNGLKPPDSPELEELRTRVAAILARDDALHIGDLDVDGAAIMEALALEPGPEVGRILQGLLDRVIEDPALNRREILLELARRSHGVS